MCHMPPLPGDPKFDFQGGIESVVDQVRQDLNVLQNGCVDAILFSNEFSMPYMLHAEPITIASMARVIGELRPHIALPFGIDYMFDTNASIDLAAATGACFVRGVISGTYASDFGLWNTNAGAVMRHIYNQRLESQVGVFYSIVPQGSTSLDSRSILDLISSLQNHMSPEAICIPVRILQNIITNSNYTEICNNRNCAVFIDGGCNHINLSGLFPKVDGAIVGTALKKDGKFENRVDYNRVKSFMEIVQRCSDN